jgi:hypothetical protein
MLRIYGYFKDSFQFMRFKKDYPCSGFLQKLPDPSIKHYRMYSHGLIREIKITLPRS